MDDKQWGEGVGRVEGHTSSLFFNMVFDFPFITLGQVKSIDKAGSKIPVPSSSSPSKTSVRSTPTNSAPGTPAKTGHLPTNGGSSVAGDVSPSRLSGERPQSLPWESIQVHSDDESQVGPVTTECEKEKNLVNHLISFRFLKAF